MTFVAPVARDRGMFENLSTRLEGIVKRIRGKGRLTEADVDEILREIRTALLEADVNVGVARDVVARIREEAIGRHPLAGRSTRRSRSSRPSTPSSPASSAARRSRSPTPAARPPSS